MNSLASMLFLPLLLLVHLADASIRLQHSILYDEIDFKGVDKITTDVCAAGCKVYATLDLTPENKEIADNIVIVNPATKTETSVFTMSILTIPGSNQKQYLELANTPTLTILNKNANRESAPLALWIVSANSPYFRTAEVYEPLNLNRAKAIAPAPITILSASSFTVKVPAGDANAVYARAAGYDAIDRKAADNCYAVLDKDFGQSFTGFALAINGPLLTLAFDTAKYPRSQVALTGQNLMSFELNPFPTHPTFISSPGFMCGSTAHQVYRSSALRSDNSFSMRPFYVKEMTFNFEMKMDTDGAHPVTIDSYIRTYDDAGDYTDTPKTQKFSGNFKAGTNEVKGVTIQANGATVSFTSGKGNDFFYGMRVWTDDDKEEQKKRPHPRQAIYIHP